MYSHHDGLADVGHVLSAFTKKMGGLFKGDGSELRGPFVYFVPKEAICGPKTFGPVPTLNLIHNPAAPGRLVGVAPPLPAYLTNAGVPGESLLAFLNISDKSGIQRDFF